MKNKKTFLFSVPGNSSTWQHFHTHTHTKKRKKRSESCNRVNETDIFIKNGKTNPDISKTVKSKKVELQTHIYHLHYLLPPFPPQKQAHTHTHKSFVETGTVPNTPQAYLCKIQTINLYILPIKGKKIHQEEQEKQMLRWLRFKCKIAEIMLVVSLKIKYTPVTQSILWLIFLRCVATIHH